MQMEQRARSIVRRQHEDTYEAELIVVRLQFWEQTGHLELEAARVSRSIRLVSVAFCPASIFPLCDCSIVSVSGQFYPTGIIRPIDEIERSYGR